MCASGNCAAFRNGAVECVPPRTKTMVLPSSRWIGRSHRASWKMIPSVCRRPLRTVLTPWRMLTR